MRKQKFLVKGTILDSDHDRLLEEKAKDIMDKSLKVGDKVAYGTYKSCYDRVGIGEIFDIWLEYGSNFNYNTHTYEPNLQVINCFLKIKFEKGGHGSYMNCTRSPFQVAKV
jgi:hypothetical protein